MFRVFNILLVNLLSLVFVTAALAQSKEPDLARLSQSGYIMGPGSGTYAINDAWTRYTKVMRFATTFDKTDKEIEAVVCGPEQNKGVLLIGEPNEFFKYVFARIATRPDSLCAGQWHVEVDIQKIEAGHKYVGEVEEYWRQQILEPSANKNVVLYMSSLNALIGLGSHSNDDTGIEREYAANVTSGKFRTVAFMDKYNYNDVIRSKHAYVLESFATKIVLPPVDMNQAGELVLTYLNALYPNFKLELAELSYLLKMGAYYLPNRPEPERSMAIINKLVRSTPGAGREEKRVAQNIETAHPYVNNTNQTWEISMPEFREIQLVFESFDVEQNYDKLVVTDEKGAVLETLTGAKGAFRSAYYPTNKIKLTFTADNDGVRNGFKINGVNGAVYKEHTFTLDETREAVMTVAQVPAWLIKRDFSIIKNLKAKLDGDVVGVAEGKADAVRLAKNGYVAGRTDDKPIATILLAGPTGTGKSYIAKRIADYTEQNLITMDMTSYKERDSFKTFQEVLSRYLTNNPYAVYLFEEIDKASMEVLDQLYFMMDEGIFYDPYQRPLFARGAFIIMTTNAGAESILANPKSPNLRKLVMDELGKSFRASFLNRYDAISLFMPFSAEEYLQLARVLLNKKIKLIGEYYDWTVKLDEPTYFFVGDKGQSKIFGARPMERLVEAVVGTGIAEWQLENGPIPAKSQVNVKKTNGLNEFELKVGTKAITYVVNPETNNGFMSMSRVAIPAKMELLFQQNRMYED
jgi:ATP-dependent Clp protease ATP-binding subunit ClpA